MNREPCKKRKKIWFQEWVNIPERFLFSPNRSAHPYKLHSCMNSPKVSHKTTKKTAFLNVTKEDFFLFEFARCLYFQTGTGRKGLHSQWVYPVTSSSKSFTLCPVPLSGEYLEWGTMTQFPFILSSIFSSMPCVDLVPVLIPNFSSNHTEPSPSCEVQVSNVSKFFIDLRHSLLVS